MGIIALSAAENYVGPSCPAGYSFKFDQASGTAWCESPSGQRVAAPGFEAPASTASAGGLGVLGWSALIAAALVVGAVVVVPYGKKQGWY